MASKIPAASPISDDSCDDDDSYKYDDDDPEPEAELDSFSTHTDLESFKCKAMQLESVERFLNQNIESLCQLVDLSPTIARLLLIMYSWRSDVVREKFSTDPYHLLSDLNIIPTRGAPLAPSHSRAVTGAIKSAQHLVPASIPVPSTAAVTMTSACEICYTEPCTDCPYMDVSCELQLASANNALLYGLSCGHRFCVECWRLYLTVQIEQRFCTNITCMAADCTILMVEDLLLALLPASLERDRYFNMMFRKMVESHPRLRYCPGRDCSVVISALEEPKARRVHCKQCNTSFCFLCGKDYHAPADCETINKWLSKCREDHSTANYMSANTKDCPKCHVFIEKNGGCNHMQCTQCQYDFCWVCAGAWSAHDTDYYVCSRYREEPVMRSEFARNRARESLNRYLFYFQRWENHELSLQLEQQQRERIQTRIHEKVMNHEGTWIDWQYLLSAADTLQKCRHTLKYTYPYAYFPNTMQRKELFEYQQGMLEAQVEDLSWKIEHAEITDRADLQNKMDVCEKRRLTLLEEFIDN